jgi:hypothetical protein
MLIKKDEMPEILACAENTGNAYTILIAKLKNGDNYNIKINVI